MSTTTLAARVHNKHGTQSYWETATYFVPRAGELIVYDADLTHTEPRFKIGDGTSAVNALPFVSGGGASVTPITNTEIDTILAS